MVRNTNYGEFRFTWMCNELNMMASQNDFVDFKPLTVQVPLLFSIWPAAPFTVAAANAAAPDAVFFYFYYDCHCHYHSLTISNTLEHWLLEEKEIQKKILRFLMHYIVAHGALLCSEIERAPEEQNQKLWKCYFIRLRVQTQTTNAQYTGTLNAHS